MVKDNLKKNVLSLCLKVLRVSQPRMSNSMLLLLLLFLLLQTDEVSGRVTSKDADQHRCERLLGENKMLQDALAKV